jgi:multiple sugar transport system ATP-binding protein
MAQLTLEHVRKVYDDSGYVAVHGLDLDVRNGEFVVLVGPSGCGKSTTLRMIAGLESISSGRLSIGGRIVNDLPPKDRDVAMVFQGYALYPHMTVFENMAFALRLRHQAGAEITARVRRAAALLELEPVLDRYPRHLSGGQRQRVAIGRAIVREPQVFLFDEPLSNLDAQLRSETRREIAALHRRLGATTVYVTHDQVEAMTLGDRIVVLNAGHAEQIDTPAALYERPATRFVASFIGSPPMNLIDGTVARGPDGPRFRSADGPIETSLAPNLALPDGTQLTLGVRPEHIAIAPGAGDAAARSPNDLTGIVEAIEPLGYETIVYVRVGPARLTARVLPPPPLVAGAPVWVRLDRDRLHLFDRDGKAVNTAAVTAAVSR